MTLARLLRRLPSAACALALAACAPCPFPQTQPPGPVATAWARDSVRVVPVQMKTLENGASGQFAPRVVRVRRGDLLRFTMTDGIAIHNIAFNGPGPGTPAVSLPPASPYLTQQGQSWQLRIDLPPGTYEFTCIPHALRGMQGTLIVESQ